jgi:hypothetical protein
LRVKAYVNNTEYNLDAIILIWHCTIHSKYTIWYSYSKYYNWKMYINYVNNVLSIQMFTQTICFLLEVPRRLVYAKLHVVRDTSFLPSSPIVNIHYFTIIWKFYENTSSESWQIRQFLPFLFVYFLYKLY